MFMMWGKKLVVRKLGHVADFCAICRCPSTFVLRRVGLARHFYYVSLGRGTLIGYERVCHECGIACAADPSVYQALAKKRRPLPALISETFPNLEEVWSERIAYERKVKHAPSTLSAEERKTVIREPFLILVPKAESARASPHLNQEFGLAVVGTIVLLMAVPALVRAVAPGQERVAAVAVLCLGLSLIVWRVAVSGRIYLRREVLPALGRALRPLRPSESEIAGVLAEMKSLGHKIGSKLRVADVLSQVNVKADGRP